MAVRPVMPSKPCENVPGSNRMVVSGKLARRHECPKCVSSMPTIVLPGGGQGGEGGDMVRLIMTGVLVGWMLTVAPAVRAEPAPPTCPPACDGIPAAAWPAP